MGRITGGSAYGHSIRDMGWGIYRLHWSWDKKYPGSRLRFPRQMTRDTDKAGAERFAKKWGCKMPDEKP